MSQKIFDQALDHQSAIQPGGPFIIQMLFQTPVKMPSPVEMSHALTRHVGDVQCLCHDRKKASFMALDYAGNLLEPQLMVMGASPFDASKVDDFTRSQMWDCDQHQNELLASCTSQVLAFDMMASALPALQRAELLMNYLEALCELYPTCVAFYFQTSGKLFFADDVRLHTLCGAERFIHFGVNARYFKVQDSDSVIVDTLGLNTLFLPDLQYHFHTLDPVAVIRHAYETATYLLTSGQTIDNNDTVDGVALGHVRLGPWPCHYEEALIQPLREVVAIEAGRYAVYLEKKAA